MGKDGTYRWERRRKRREGQKARREFQAFWGFELVLLILIFFIWLAGGRIFLMYAIVESPCIEAAASFGASPGLPSAFGMFLWITGLAALFWTAISLAFHKIVWKSKSGVFHFSLLICLIFLAGIFNSMHIDDVNPPDGELAVPYLIVDTASGEPEYLTPYEPFPEYYEWKMKRDGIDYYEYSPRSCVWVETGLIEVDGATEIPGYTAASYEERLNLPGRRFVRPEYFEPEVSYWGAYKTVLSSLYGSNSSLERLKERQIYRPMTDDEKARFAAKAKCINEAVTGHDEELCKWYWVFDEERFRWEHYYSPDAERIHWR